MTGLVIDELYRLLEDYLSPILAKSIADLAVTRSGVDLRWFDPGDEDRLLEELERGVKLFADNYDSQSECIDRARVMVTGERRSSDRKPRSSNVPIVDETDIVTARDTGRELAVRLGFGIAAQTKIATVISELARNILQYAGQGEIRLTVLFGSARWGLEIVAWDEGPGITDLDRVLHGDFKSTTGMGKGLCGTKKLVNEFEVETSPGHGTVVTARIYIV
jgi:serine/threonine-protein kinase RsbT